MYSDLTENKHLNADSSENQVSIHSNSQEGEKNTQKTAPKKRNISQANVVNQAILTRSTEYVSSGVTNESFERKATIFYSEWTPSIVSELIKSHQNLSQCVDSNGITPLHWAAVEADGKTVKDLCALNVNILAVTKPDNFTALHWACYAGKENVVDALIECKANINAWDASGRTPLYWAIYYSHEGVAKKLREQGAQTPEGMELHYAVLVNDTAMCEKIIRNNDCKKYLLVKNAYNQNPFDLAVLKGDEKAIKNFMRFRDQEKSNSVLDSAKQSVFHNELDEKEMPTINSSNSFRSWSEVVGSYHLFKNQEDSAEQMQTGAVSHHDQKNTHVQEEKTLTEGLSPRAKIKTYVKNNVTHKIDISINKKSPAEVASDRPFREPKKTANRKIQIAVSHTNFLSLSVSDPEISYETQDSATPNGTLQKPKQGSQMLSQDSMRTNTQNNRENKSAASNNHSNNKKTQNKKNTKLSSEKKLSHQPTLNDTKFKALQAAKQTSEIIKALSAYQNDFSSLFVITEDKDGLRDCNLYQLVKNSNMELWSKLITYNNFWFTNESDFEKRSTLRTALCLLLNQMQVQDKELLDEMLCCIEKNGLSVQDIFKNQHIQKMKTIGVQFDFEEDQWLSPLRMAIKYNKSSEVATFIEKNPDLLNRQDVLDGTPLHSALRRERKEIAQFLIKKGADLNVQGNKGFSALHHVCQSGDIETLELIIDEVDLRGKTDDGVQAIQLAKARGHLNIVERLLKKEPTLLNE